MTIGAENRLLFVVYLCCDSFVINLIFGVVIMSDFCGSG